MEKNIDKEILKLKLAKLIKKKSTLKSMYNKPNVWKKQTDIIYLGDTLKKSSLLNTYKTQRLLRKLSKFKT